MRRLAIIAVLGAGLAALAATTGPSRDTPRKRVAFAVTTGDLSVAHAAQSSLPQALGFWKDEGLEVQTMSLDSAVIMHQLAARSVTLVSIGPDEIVMARERGIKVKGFYV